MVRVTFVESDGTESVVNAEEGISLMRAATETMVPGILGDCGGSCNCGTCHGYIANEFVPLIPGPSENELMMLEGVLEVKSNSRLTCQVVVSRELEGLVVHLPESQY